MKILDVNDLLIKSSCSNIDKIIDFKLIKLKVCSMIYSKVNSDSVIRLFMIQVINF